LLNCHNQSLRTRQLFQHAALRTRKLLVHQEEIRKLIGKTQQKGLTLIPTRMYFKNGRVKIELALARGNSTGINVKPNVAEPPIKKRAKPLHADARAPVSATSFRSGPPDFSSM